MINLKKKRGGKYTDSANFRECGFEVTGINLVAEARNVEVVARVCTITTIEYLFPREA